MCGRSSANGAIQKDCPRILWGPSWTADTWNASPKNAAHATRRASHRMHEGQKPYLAFDLGAESGRAVLGRVRSGVITIEELHRFPNEPVEYAGGLHWDAPRLWFEMRKTLAQLADRPLAGIGVDTWGVDYALLGEHGELIENPYHYRDGRTQGV